MADTEKLEKTIDKIVLIDQFMSNLEKYTKGIAAEAVGRHTNSCEIWGSQQAAKAKKNMEETLHALFDIEMEDNG